MEKARSGKSRTARCCSRLAPAAGSWAQAYLKRRKSSANPRQAGYPPVDSSVRRASRRFRDGRCIIPAGLGVDQGRLRMRAGRASRLRTDAASPIVQSSARPDAPVRRDTPPRIPVAETVAVAADRRQAVGVDGGSAALHRRTASTSSARRAHGPGGDGAQFERAQADRQVVIEHCVDTRRGERLCMPNCGSFAAVSPLAMTGAASGEAISFAPLRRCSSASPPT